MASHRNKGGSAARNAPFGTDVQPKRNLKIVGGKQIEIAVDSPPTSASSSQRSLPPLQQGPNGTPPMVMQPSVPEYNNNKHQVDYSEKRERVIQSQTAPADKSNSHIHGARGRFNSLPGTLTVLPPIPSPNSLSPTSRRSWFLPQSRSPSPSGSLSPVLRLGRQEEEVRLTDQLHRLLAGYDPYRFQDLYKDLAESDRALSGFVGQPQVNMAALRHGLPLPTTTLHLLLSNFAREGDPEQINYERLIQFLARAQLGTAEAHTLLEESVNRFVNASALVPLEEVILDEQISKYETTAAKKQKHRHHQPKPPKPDRSYSERVTVQAPRHEPAQGLEAESQSTDAAKKPLVFSDRQDAKLLMLLEQQYVQGNQEATDLQAMRRDFQDRDKNRLGTLAKEKVQEVCFKHRIPLQGSLMDKLLHRCSSGNDQYSWVAFLEFLGRVKPLALAGQDTEDKHEPNRPNTWPRQRGDSLPEVTLKPASPKQPKEPRPPPWETRKPLGRLGVMSPTSVEQEITQFDSPSPPHGTPTTPPPLPQPMGGHAHGGAGAALDDGQRAELANMASQHKARRRAARAQAQAQPRAQDKREPWFARFKHLAQGLYNLDSTNTGYLSTDETLGLVKNYNLIYNLGLEQPVIDKCVSRCCHSQGRVSIEHLLEALTHYLK